MNPLLRFFRCLVLTGLAAAGLAHAVEPAEPGEPAAPPAAGQEVESPETEPETAAFAKLLKSIDWVRDGTGELGDSAQIKVPAGYRFTGSDGTQKLMAAYGNLVSGNELGYLAPEGLAWCAVFGFHDCGYVKDDEKDKLDADAILKQLQEAQVKANEALKARGLPELTVTGWETPPFYNPQTHNLEWAVRLTSSTGGESINYRTKLLGRKGVMNVVLVCEEKDLAAAVPAYEKLLSGFSFKKEASYAAFRNGDKVAEYGLTGLVLGGGLLVAAKSGLLGKLLKPLVLVVLAVSAFGKRLFGRIFKGKSRNSL